MRGSDEAAAAQGDTRSRRSRGSITPAEILEAAFALADRVGLDALSMPELARELDLPVTSLYWHFRRRDDLLSAMVEEAISARAQLLPAVGTSPSWHAYLRDYFTAMRKLYREHDTFADLLVVRLDLATAESQRRATQASERIVGYLMGSGFDEDTAARIVRTMEMYTNGAILAERNRDRRLGEIDTEAERDFEFGLDTLVSGFERIERPGAQPHR